MEELASAKRSHNAHKGLFGQRIKAFESRVASFKRSPEVPQNWAEVEDAFEKVKLSYDKLQNAYTEVIIMESTKWSFGGVIKSIRDNGRSYVVETDGGAAYLRNRRYIKASTATARRNVVGASIAAVDKGKKREGVRFKLIVQFKEPGSKD